MAKAAYHKPDNVEILDMHRGADTSSVRFPEGGCTKPNPRLMCLALHLAKNWVREDLKAKGIPRSYIEGRTVNLLANQLLEERRSEFLERARQMIERWDLKRSNLKTNAQKRKQPNSMTSAVQMSGSKVEPQS
jgi:hypothetical protein